MFTDMDILSVPLHHPLH